MRLSMGAGSEKGMVMEGAQPWMRLRLRLLFVVEEDVVVMSKDTSQRLPSTICCVPRQAILTSTRQAQERPPAPAQGTRVQTKGRAAPPVPRPPGGAGRKHHRGARQCHPFFLIDTITIGIAESLSVSCHHFPVDHAPV